MSNKMASFVTKVSALAKAGVDAAIPKLTKFGGYAKVELTPPTPGEIGQGFAGFSKVIKSATTGSFMKLTMKEAWVNTLVGTEIICWFFVGECIGKGSIIGYQV